MYTQKVFKAGNSHIVSIPSEILTELSINAGDQVSVSTRGNSVVINKKIKSSSSKKTEEDFQQWLDVFMRDNGETLDELAKR